MQTSMRFDKALAVLVKQVIITDNKTEKTLNKEVRMLLPKKDLIQVE